MTNTQPNLTETDQSSVDRVGVAELVKVGAVAGGGSKTKHGVRAQGAHGARVRIVWLDPEDATRAQQRAPVGVVDRVAWVAEEVAAPAERAAGWCAAR